MDNPLTIVHLDCGRTWGGGQAQVFMLIDGLRVAGHRNILICREGSPLARRASKEGIASVARANFGVITMPKVVGILRRVCETENADILHLHDSRSHSIGALYAISTPERPATVVSRRVAFARKDNAFSRWKYRHGVDRYVAISEAAAETITAHGVARDKIDVVPSCYAEEPDFARKGSGELREGLKIDNEANLIGSVGGLTEVKGHIFLLRALRQVLQEREDCYLVLAGDGTQKEFLQDTADELGIASRVFFLGFLTDLAPVYADLDLFVLPSLVEGLNSSLLQAMAWGIPCVASNVGGVPEAVADGKEGLLVPPREPDLIARAILRILSDSTLSQSMGVSGREKAKRVFSREAMVSQTEDIYGELVKKKMISDSEEEF